MLPIIFISFSANHDISQTDFLNHKERKIVRRSEVHPYPSAQITIFNFIYKILIIKFLKLFLEISHYSSNIPPYQSPCQKFKFSLGIDIFPIYFEFLPLFFVHVKPQENPPCPLMDQHFTFSLKIMTLPTIFNFWNVDTAKPEKN